jgi:tRNA(fMet)-specific endonuclease VapC
MMRYMLDTNICIYLAKHRPTSVVDRFRGLAVGQVCISSIVYAELRYGCEGSQQREASVAALDGLLGPIDIVEFDTRAAEAFGCVRQKLKQIGRPIGPFDTLIAAHALSLGCILVTNNYSEFERVDNLAVENWVQ